MFNFIGSFGPIKICTFRIADFFPTIVIYLINSNNYSIANCQTAGYLLALLGLIFQHHLAAL